MLLAIEQLSISPPEQELHLDKSMVLQIVEFYNKKYKESIENADPTKFDPQTFVGQIEDKIHSEFGIELNDVINHFLTSDDYDIKSKMNELKQSFSSIRKLNQSIFE